MDRSGNATNEVDIESCKDLQEGTLIIIRVQIYSDPHGDDHTGRQRVFLINVFPKACSSRWTVRRTYKDFVELETFYRSTLEPSEMMAKLSFAVPDEVESNPVFFENFLEHLLFHVGDYLWRCPQILSFLDDTMNMPSIRDTQIAVLTKQIVDLTAGYNSLESKLCNTGHTCNCVSEKLAKLDKVHESYGEDDQTDQQNQHSSGLFNKRTIQLKLTTNAHCYGPGTDAPIRAGSSVEHVALGAKISIEAIRALSDIALKSEAGIKSQEAAANQKTATTDAIMHSGTTRTSIEMARCKLTSTTVGGENTRNAYAELVNDTENVIEGKGSDLSAIFDVQKNRVEEITDVLVSPLDKLEDSVPPPAKIHTYRNNRHLPISAMSEREAPDDSDAAIAAIVNLLTPHDDQLAYRASAHAYLSRSVRNSLKAKIFESGLHAIKTFLPDDPIRLTVLLWRGNSTNWLTNLGDKLRCLTQPGASGVGQGSAGGMGSNNSPIFDDDSFNEANGLDVDNEPKPTGEHSISNINPSTANGHSRMHCNIDAVSVEIIPNGRSDICFLALIEEISELVGKKELFKRSLLLIRAWWTYETSAYVDVSAKTFFSDSVLCVLVSSIFNQYHAVIHQPLQALSIFLAEYSDIEWGDVAVTLQGVVPFHSTGVLEHQPWLREPLISELVTSAILQKHCDFYHMSSASSSNSRASATPHTQAVGDSSSPTLDNAHSSDRTPTSNPEVAVFRSGAVASSSSASTTFENTAPSSVSATPYGTGTVSTAATVAAAAVLLAGKGTNTAPKKPPSDSHCYSPTAVRNFQKRVINIVHPLTNANMISASSTPDRVFTISQIFETGACELHKALLSYKAMISTDEDLGPETRHASHPAIATAPIENFFRATLLRFSSGWRPDLFKGHLPGFAPSASEDIEQEGGKILTFSGVVENDEIFSTDRSTVSTPSRTVSCESFFDQIRYMDLVLVGRVSESALLALSQDILVGRGVLPVGEIGKSLQDIAPTRNLSGKIKEKYGGLKKFLERYPEDVVICADHPFNPHVFLRKPLSAADLELIERGVIPPLLRKAMALRNKMRGGGTAIGALDGFSGPTVNSYSPGQGQGPMGPANNSRQMSSNMIPSCLYSPHNGTNTGVMQNHMPVIGSRLPRNGSMVSQNQIFGQGQTMSHQAQSQLHNPGQVPAHIQSHQQHMHQAYKPQMAHGHQIQIPQNLGQGQSYRNEGVQGMPLQGNLSPRNQFSAQPHTPRSRDEMNSIGLMGGRGIAVGDTQVRSHSLPIGSFIMPQNNPRSGLSGHGHHQYPLPLRSASDTGPSSVGSNINPIDPYSPFINSRDRRALLSERDREMNPLVLGDRNISHIQNQRDAPIFGGQNGFFNTIGDTSGRRRYSDLAPVGFGIQDGNRDASHTNERQQDRKMFDLFRNQSQDTYRESPTDGYREQDSLIHNDPYRDDIGRDSDLSLKMASPNHFGPPSASMRGAAQSMSSSSKAFSERDNADRMERDREREFGMDRWRDNQYTYEAEERERELDRARDRDRYVDIDYGAEVNCGLFSSKGISSNQILSDDSPLELFDLRNQGGYQQPRNSSATKATRSSYFRDPDNTEDTVPDEDEHERFSIQKQQPSLGLRQDFQIAKNQFDPKKWI